MQIIYLGEKVLQLCPTEKICLRIYIQSLVQRDPRSACFFISVITDKITRETKLGGQCSMEHKTPVALPEESSGEHWWPSGHWSPALMCQDPPQLPALMAAAGDVPNTLWSGS